MIEDVLSWDLFKKGAVLRKDYPPKKVELFNRLIAHTNNFFAVIGFGAFTPGYVMIVAKKLIPAFSLVEDKDLEELHWFISAISQTVNKKYNRKVVIFEHGMCACVGGLDRAHLHLMSIDEKLTSEDIKSSINKILKVRKSGIESVEVNGHKLENIHDIQQIMNSSEKNKYKINGIQLNFDDIKNNLDQDNWPISTRNHVRSGGHYVYFNSGFKESSFLTNRNFNTQFGREVVFDLEIKKNNLLSKFNSQQLEKNPYANVWKWQEFSFNENILKTMSDLKNPLTEITSNSMSKKFNYFSY